MDSKSRIKVRRAGFRIFRVRVEELAIYEQTSRGGWKKVQTCSNGVNLDRAFRKIMEDDLAIKD